MNMEMRVKKQRICKTTICESEMVQTSSSAHKPTKKNFLLIVSEIATPVTVKQ